MCDFLTRVESSTKKNDVDNKFARCPIRAIGCSIDEPFSVVDSSLIQKAAVILSSLSCY